MQVVFRLVEAAIGHLQFYKEEPLAMQPSKGPPFAIASKRKTPYQARLHGGEVDASHPPRPLAATTGCTFLARRRFVANGPDLTLEPDRMRPP